MKKIAIIALMMALYLSSCGDASSSSSISEEASSRVESTQEAESSVEESSQVAEVSTEEASQAMEESLDEPLTPPKSFLLTKVEEKRDDYVSITEKKYNDNGLLIETITNTNGKLSQKNTFDYNDKGIKTEDAFYIYDESGELIGFSKTAYTIDENGVEQGYTVMENGGFVTVTKEYDEQGKLSSEKAVGKNGVVYLTTYEYDEQGRLALMKMSDVDTEIQPHYFTRVEYIYPENSEGYTTLSYDTLGTTIKTVYDKNENILEYVNTDENGVITYSCISEYDEHNNEIKSILDEMVTEYKHTYENGLLVCTQVLVDGEEFDKATCTYDKYGNLLKTTHLSAAGTVKGETIQTWTAVY